MKPTLKKANYQDEKQEITHTCEQQEIKSNYIVTIWLKSVDVHRKKQSSF